MVVRLSNGKLMQCPKFNPKTRGRCTMAMGHAGPHKVGGPYKTTEEFIIKCYPACDYSLSNNYNVCWKCGHEREVDSEKS